VFVSYVGGSEEDDEWIAVSKVCESMSVAVAVAVAVSVCLSASLSVCVCVCVLMVCNIILRTI
jgi:hypothetical protein